MPMTQAKRVVRSDLWLNPVFDARLAQEQDISLGVFPVRGNPAAAWDMLAGAHVYHVSAAKDELPQEWFATGELIARCPRLFCVSSSGAGYDTVDVPACTAAGIAVVNQAGGNAVSVAEHTLAMMLGVSRRMVEGDRRIRREIGYAREDVMGHEISGRTIGLVGIGHIGTRVAALARAFGMQVVAFDPHLTPEEIERRGARPGLLGQVLQGGHSFERVHDQLFERAHRFHANGDGKGGLGDFGHLLQGTTHGFCVTLQKQRTLAQILPEIGRFRCEFDHQRADISHVACLPYARTLCANMALNRATLSWVSS
ncbi:MAG: 3-phosphoglycerate dehydrogenase [Mycobacteriaceae bacterium]|nr:3-phosphoglycerate dehydrogenase [Mycobacteriaceae bacterium]